MAGNELQPDATAPTGTGPRGDATPRPGIDYRQLQQTTELRQPWHIPSSGAAGEELANALKGFSKGAEHVGDTLNTQAGKAAGSAAGTDTANFQPKTVDSPLSPLMAASYNAAAQATLLTHRPALRLQSTRPSKRTRMTRSLTQPKFRKSEMRRSRKRLRCISPKCRRCSIGALRRGTTVLPKRRSSKGSRTDLRRIAAR